MTDIPDDIMSAARNFVVEDLGMDSPGLLQTSYIDCIAEAILAERERSRQLLKREAEAKRIAANAEAYGYGHGIEAAATLLDKAADEQKLAWDAHIASGSGNAATSHEAVYRSLASQVRALQSEER